MITVEQKKDRTLEVFLRTVKRYNLLKKGDSILVAVSGGPDSVALFDLLYQIRTDWHLNLHVIHLNHQLRGEDSEKDHLFTEKFARDLKMPISIKRADVEAFARENRMSTEEAARECRLQFFREEAARLGIKKVALAHHRDDQAETVLFRILRGTGLKGLGAMKASSEWQGLTLVRPLLDLEKKEILDYVRERKLTYCVDVTNQEAKFMRNRIRNRLLPELEKYYNPKIKNVLSSLAETVSLDMQYIEDAVAKHYPKVIKKRKPEFLLLKKKKFTQQPEALKFRILQRAVKEVDPESDLDYSHWDEFRAAVERDHQGFEMHLANEISVSLQRKEIVLKRAAAVVKPYEYALPLGGRIVVKEIGTEFTCEVFDRRIYKVDRKDRTCGIFDLERIGFPIAVRNRREGDVFQPLGLHHEKKLKDFFIGRKIQNYEKDQIPLLASKGEIFWVYGVEISDKFKVTHRTRRFLKVTGRSIA